MTRIRGMGTTDARPVEYLPIRWLASLQNENYEFIMAPLVIRVEVCASWK